MSKAKESSLENGILLVIIAVVFMFILFGFILPFLFSAKSTLLVITGVVVILGIFIALVYSIVKSFTKKPTQVVEIKIDKTNNSNFTNDQES